MRTLIALFFCGVLTNNHGVCANNIDVTELRKLYYNASESKQYREQFYKRIISIGDRSMPILLCYKSMALFLRCRHQINPYCKLADFKAGKELLEKAVKLDPGNMEIRFMRFCVQSQAPRMLGYYSMMAEDKDMIINSWKRISDRDLKNKIKAYMLAYGNISEQEKIYLQ